MTCTQGVKVRLYYFTIGELNTEGNQYSWLPHISFATLLRQQRKYYLYFKIVYTVLYYHT